MVVNLYPFSATAAKPGVTPEELIENIDIGGPAMVRSAAKNFQSVGVVTDPGDYAGIAAELREKHELSLATRLNLARKAYARTARYDGEIATELERLSVSDQVPGGIAIGALEKLPQRMHIALERRQSMRYGENPHQAASLYIPAGYPAAGLAGAKQLQGKELSYNNLVDLDSAWALAQEFHRPAVAIIKHNNPCGAAEQESLSDAYRKALACDPVSAFGGVLAFNRVLDVATAEEVAKLFVECIVAPGYAAAALEKLGAKKNLRLLEMLGGEAVEELDLKRISGGMLAQEADRHELAEAELKVVTERAPTPAEMRALLFRVESLQAREIECDCVCARGANGGRWRRTDEPSGFREDCGDQGGDEWAGARGQRRGFRCFFSISGWFGGGGRGGSNCRDPAGRVHAGCGRDCGSERLGMAMVFSGVRHFRH